RFVNAVVAYGEYVKLTLWPQDLAVLYRYRIDHSWFRIVLSLVGFCTCFGYFFHLRKRYPYLLVGWCWFVGTMVPVIGLVQVGGQAWADRYTYFPTIGLLLALVWFGSEVTVKKWRSWLFGFVLVLAFFYLGLSWNQSRYWHDTVSLFQRAVAVDQNNPVAYNLLGLALTSEKRWPEADQAFSKALKLNPRFGQALVNWGNALQDQERNSEAESLYRKAMRPDINEIDAFVALAALRKKEHRLDEAEKILYQVLRLAPADAGVNYNLGTVLLTKGQAQASIEPFERALKGRPYHIKTRVNLAIAMANLGQFDNAAEQFSYAVQLDPANRQALYNLKQLRRLQERQSGAGR
ncbi:tetratricopeptide repeat protein, partial [bacterium]|nr:tetratricopeptide repeat protein [bacterium]